MKIYKLIYLSLLLLLLPLGSCEHEDDDFPSSGTYTAVNFQVPSLSVGSDTRATVALAEGTTVTVYAYEVVGGVESSTYTQSKLYTADASGALVPDNGKPMALLSGLTYMFYAVSPVHSLASGSEKQFELGHSYTEDFKVSSLQETLTSSTANLAFEALRLEYSAIRLTLQRDTESTSVTSIAPDVSKGGVSFTELTRSPYLYTLGDAGIDASSSEVDGSLDIPVSAITEVTANELYTSLGYVLPKKSAPFRITAYITANGTTPSTFSAEIPEMAFLPGKKYTFTVLFTDPKVYLTLKVTDWDGVETSGDLGGDEGITLIGDWVTDNWDPGLIGSGDQPNTILVDSWDVSPEAWSTGDMGAGDSNILHLGDWNGTSWGAGNVATDHPNSANGDDWNNSDSWDANNTGAGNGDDTLDGSDWGSGSWNAGDVATDHPNTVDGDDWSNGGSWDANNTGAGNGDNTLGGNDWSSDTWNTGNVATDRPNAVNSDDWNNGGSWNATNTGAGTGNAIGGSSWGSGSWGTGSTGTDSSNSTVTAPWDTKTNDMGNMGGE